MENINSYLNKVIKDNQRKSYKRNNSKLTDVSKDFKAEKLYIGAQSRNTKVHLRIYNKKEEQLS